jgi:hypothetical protein
MRKDIFRPIRSAFRDFWCGESDDARIIKIESKKLPLLASKPKSKKEGEVVGLSNPNKRETRWGNEIINIDNY